MRLRSNILGFARDARRAERAGRPAIMARQQSRLADLLRFARARSPLYHSLYRHLPDHVTDLRQLPPVTKPQLMASFDEWATDPNVTRAGVEAFVADKTLVGHRYFGRYAVWTTSGSTGDSGSCLHDADAVALYRGLTLARGWLPWMTARRLATMLRLGNRVATVVASGDHYGSASIAEASRRDHPWPFNRVRVFSPLAPMPELVQTLNDFQPALLLGYPSALTLLAQEQRAGRLAIRPALVGSGGEWLDPSSRETIESAFACRLRENYGATEFPPLAWECRAARLHVSADWSILEPVDEAYRPVPAGQPSHTTLLTNLANRIQPIIRYELGDRVVMGTDRCPCGSPLPVVQVEGRREETLYFQTPSGATVPLLAIPLACVVYQTPGARRCQVVQTGPATLRVRIEASSGAVGHRTSEAAIGRLRGYLSAHGLAHVDVEQAAESPRPDPVSGKYQMVWSEVSSGAPGPTPEGQEPVERLASGQL